jgi:hypothetical protein
MSERASIQVLNECAELQLKKSQDYQNPSSSVRQADYYPNGILTINDVVWAKMLRIKSLLEAGGDPNFESLEDSYKDMINYASFAVAWIRKGVPGQDPSRDLFNRPVKDTYYPGFGDGHRAGDGMPIEEAIRQGLISDEMARSLGFQVREQAPTLEESQRQRSYPGKKPANSTENMWG